MKRIMVLCLFSLLTFVGSFAFMQGDDLERVIAQALSDYQARPGAAFYYREADRLFDANGRGGVVYLELVSHDTGEVIPGIIELLIVVADNDGWVARLPAEPFYGTALQQLPTSLVDSIDTKPYKAAADPVLISVEALTSYQLPFEHGQFGTVTRSFGSHGRGQIDFDLTGLNVAAAKDGTIVYVNDSHNTSAYNTGAWWYWNVVVIQHGAHEYSMYGHLARNSVPAWIKALCSTDYGQSNCNVPVMEGDIIALEGNTGYSSAQHLHVEFGQNYGVIAYQDTEDEDRDGDRIERVYTGYVYAEQNIAFSGYALDEVEWWPYGRVEQAGHNEPVPTFNVIRNGDFSADTSEWQPSGQISWSVEDGVMRALRLNTAEPPDWASFRQDLNYGAPANYGLEVMLELGNSSTIQKTVSVNIYNSSGRDYGIVSCDFVIPPNTPLQPYTLRGRTNSTWANVRLEIAVNPPDSAPAALVDNVLARHVPDVRGLQCD